MPIAPSMGHESSRPGLRAITLLAVLAAGLGCATPGTLLPSYDYFVAPDPDDPWSRKIYGWQVRERSDRRALERQALERSGEVPDLAAPASVAEPGGRDDAPEATLPEELEDKYRAFRAQRRRQTAREIATWIQDQARDHYVPDGPIDRWATLAETLRGNGDDCDGLELLTYNLLRQTGFAADEVYRAIVYRRSDGQHHMVTLWFEDRGDPWVIDPTGAMTSGMPRMSEVPGWVPLKVFSEDEDFTVERIHFARASR